MKTKQLISRLLFGDGLPSRSMAFWNGWAFNTDTRRGRFGEWMSHQYLSMRLMPQRIRYEIADRLMRAAMRLRGEKPSVFGWYDMAAGNEAARLLDRLDTEFVLLLVPDDYDRMNEMRFVLNRLASLSRAAWARTTDEERA